MGQKVNPVGMRVGIIRDWQSRWYANDRDYGTTLIEDVKIREFIENYYKKLAEKAADQRKADAQISRIEIERSAKVITIIVRTGRPGVLIGQEGKSISGLKEALEKQLNKGVDKKNKKSVQINAVEVANPNLDARLVARWIANELEARRSFRATQKKAIQNTMRSGAKGIKTAVSGRLGGADMARTEGYSEGVVPLHTLRSDIDYAHEEAATQYGRLGVKVWICRGEVLPGEMVKEPEAPKQRPRRNNNRRPNNRRGGNDNRNPRAAAPKAAAAPAAEEKGGNE